MWLGYLGDALVVLALFPVIFFIRKEFNVWRACLFSASTWIMSCGLLAYAHLADVRQILGVFEHSHASLPFGYRLAALWTYFDGSFLLWTACLASACLLRYHTHKNRSQSEGAGWLLLLLGHGLIILLSAQPFAILQDLPAEGLGFNPTLHAPHVVFHPPLMYMGLALMAIPALQSMSQSRNLTEEELCQRYSRWAYILITIGLAWGGLWAYTELGWGGMWFWDPVETMALIPWVAHLMVWHQWPRHPDRGWQWAPLPFVLTLFQVWGVRSGWIASIHSFARDDEKGWLLLIGACIFAGIFIWHALRIRASSHTTTLPLFFSMIGIMILGIVWPLMTTGAPDASWFHGMLLPCLTAGAWLSTPKNDRLWLFGVTLLGTTAFTTTPDPTWINTCAWGIGVWIAAGAWRLAQGQRLGHLAFGLLLMTLSWKATWSYEFQLSTGESFHGWHLEQQNTTYKETPFGVQRIDFILLNNQPTAITTETYHDGTVVRRMGTIIGWWSHWQIMPCTTNDSTPTYMVGYRHGIHGVWLALLLLILACNQRRLTIGHRTLFYNKIKATSSR